MIKIDWSKIASWVGGLFSKPAEALAQALGNRTIAVTNGERGTFASGDNADIDNSTHNYYFGNEIAQKKELSRQVLYADPLIAKLVPKLEALPDSRDKDHQTELRHIAQKLFVRRAFTHDEERDYVAGLYAVFLTRLIWEQEVLSRIDDERAGRRVRKNLGELENFMVEATKVDPQIADELLRDAAGSRDRFISAYSDQVRKAGGHFRGFGGVEAKRIVILRRLQDNLRSCKTTTIVGQEEKAALPE